MKRRLVLAALLLFTLGAAKGNTPLQLTTNHKSQACNVEQQTYPLYGSFNPTDPCPGPNVVNNPTNCVWDIDDAWAYRGEGSINVGQTVSASFCQIADGTHSPPVDSEVRAKNDKLSVRVDSSDGRFWIATPVRDGNEYQYTTCGTGLLQRFPHPEVPNSNGGRGTLVIYTLTISAPTRGATNVGALFKYGQGIWTVPVCE